MATHQSPVTTHQSPIMEPQNSSNVRIEWSVHPIRKNWKVSVGVVSFLLALCAAIYFSFNSVALLALSIAILTCSLAPFFFPTTYTLQDDCITVRSSFLRRFSRHWDSFRSYYPDRSGVLLSPFSHPSRLENFRGVYVRFSYNESEVMAFIKEKIEGKEKGEQTDV